VWSRGVTRTSLLSVSPLSLVFLTGVDSQVGAWEDAACSNARFQSTGLFTHLVADAAAL